MMFNVRSSGWGTKLSCEQKKGAFAGLAVSWVLVGRSMVITVSGRMMLLMICPQRWRWLDRIRLQILLNTAIPQRNRLRCHPRNALCCNFDMDAFAPSGAVGLGMCDWTDDGYLPLNIC